MINNKLVYINLITTLLILISLALYPKLDLEFSNFFYLKEQGFIYKNNFLVKVFFNIIPIVTWFIISGLLILLILTKYFTKDKKFLPYIFYLSISLATGPGLIVNTICKENIGRARPEKIENFGGTKLFSPVFTSSNQCDHNCSFPSGHAAMAYYISSIAYILAIIFKNKNIFNFTYLFFIIFGHIVGMSRILDGGHFLSDVLTSYFIIISLNHLLYKFLIIQNK